MTFEARLLRKIGFIRSIKPDAVVLIKLTPRGCRVLAAGDADDWDESDCSGPGVKSMKKLRNDDLSYLG